MLIYNLNPLETDLGLLLQIANPDNFGIFSTTIGIIFAIIASLWAIRAKVFGGNKKWWKGSDEFHVKTAPRIGQIISIIGFAAMYLLTTADDFKFYLILGGILGVITLALYLRYIFMLELHVIKKHKVNAAGAQTGTVLIDVICGNEYTALAKDHKKQQPYDSDEKMLQVSNNEYDYWTKRSIAKARVRIVAIFILLQVAGALTVSQAGLVVQVVTTGRAPFQPETEQPIDEVDSQEPDSIGL